jgi:hypothetical protein
MQYFHQSALDYDILCADKPSKDKQLIILVAQLYENPKIQTWGRFKFVIHMLFTETNKKPLHLLPDK